MKKIIVLFALLVIFANPSVFADGIEEFNLTDVGMGWWEITYLFDVSTVDIDRLFGGSVDVFLEELRLSLNRPMKPIMKLSVKESALQVASVDFVVKSYEGNITSGDLFLVSIVLDNLEQTTYNVYVWFRGDTNRFFSKIYSVLQR